MTAEEKAKRELQDYYEKLYTEYKGRVVGLKFVTPELAASFMKRNTNNYRKKKDNVVRKLCYEILKQKWDITGESITFDENGVMTEGQHRCDAIMKSGISVPTVVIWNVPASSKFVVGGSEKRTLNDRLNLDDEDHVQILGASLRMYYGLNNAKHVSVSNSELVDLLETIPEIRDSVKKYHKKVPGSPISPTVAAYSHFILSKKDPVESDEFLEKLIYGVELKKKDPTLILRNLISDIKKKGSSLEGSVAVSFIFKTWNAIRNNEKISAHKLTKDFSIPEVI